MHLRTRIPYILLLPFLFVLAMFIVAMAQDVGVTPEAGFTNMASLLAERFGEIVLLGWIIYWFTKTGFPRWMSMMERLADSQAAAAAATSALNTTLTERNHKLDAQDEMLRQACTGIQKVEVVMQECKFWRGGHAA